MTVFTTLWLALRKSKEKAKLTSSIRGISPSFRLRILTFPATAPTFGFWIKGATRQRMV